MRAGEPTLICALWACTVHLGSFPCQYGCWITASRGTLQRKFGCCNPTHSNLAQAHLYKRPPLDARNMYDVFCNIRDDEKEHIKTMKACRDYSIVTDLSRRKAGRTRIQEKAPDAATAEMDTTKLT